MPDTTEKAPTPASGIAVLDAPVAPGGGRGRRSAYLDRKLTEGSIPRNLLHLAWPQAVAGALQAVDQLADLAWAGFIGTQAIASIGVAQSWSQLAQTARMGLDTSTRAMVSRAVGADNVALANHIAMQSLLLSGGISFIVCVLGIIFTEALMRMLGVSEGVIAQGAMYMRWQFVAVFSMALLMSSGAALQASGDAISAMRAQMVTRVLHIAVSPLLVFGWLLAPKLGLEGASIASAAAQFVGAGLNFYVLFTGRSRLHLTLKGVRPDYPLLWRMIKLGAPASVTTAERSLAQLLLVGLVTPFGDLALAAYSITNRVQMFVNLGGMGLGQASGILVGQNLGAQQPERAKATVWWALGYALIANCFIGGLVFLFPEWFLRIFSRDAALLAVAIPWLHIQVVAFMIQGTSLIFNQTFNTAGDTLVPMAVTLTSIWGVQQPAALILSGVAQTWEVFGYAVPVPAVLNLGELGIAWAVVIGMAVRLLIYFPYFWWGPWLKKKVF